MRLLQVVALLLSGNSGFAFECGRQWKDVPTTEPSTDFTDFTDSYSDLSTLEPQPFTLESEDAVNPPEIIGGSTADEGQWPWQVGLHITSPNDEFHFCGGTLISNNFVLTAAHCAEIMDPTRSYVILGTTSVNGDGGVTLTIAEVFKHPNFVFNASSPDADIALIKLATPVNFTRLIQPICLFSDNESFAFETAFVTGWGVYNVENSTDISDTVSNELLQAQVPIIEQAFCAERWAYIDNITIRGDQICAGAFKHGTGSGDSGGPLQVENGGGVWFQVGVTSFGSDTDVGYIEQDVYPGVYTRVSSFCAFIEETTKGEAVCCDTAEESASSLSTATTKSQANTTTTTPRPTTSAADRTITLTIVIVSLMTCL